VALIRNPNPELTFDGLDCFGINTYNDQEFELTAMQDGHDWGTPKAIVTWLTGVLQAGAVASVQGWEVREAVLPMRVRAETSLGLGAGDTALGLACGKRTTIVWTPPDGWSPPTVFDVLLSELEPITDTDADLRQTRHYRIRLSLHPFARSVDPVTVEDSSTVTVEDTTVRNDGSSASGWTGSGGAVSVVSGKVRTSVSGIVQSGLTMWLEQASINLTDATKPYLRVTWTSQGIKNPQVSAVINGVTVPPSAQSSGVAWFPISAFVSGAVRFVAKGPSTTPGIPATYRLEVDEVAVTNANGIVFSRQKQFTLEIPGAARTEAALTVSHASTALGDVLLYTYPAALGPNYQPILHNYRTSGGARTTTGGPYVSGSREPIGTSGDRPTYTIPASDLPQGTYTLVMRARTTGTAGRRSISWSATVGSAVESGTATVTNTWQMVTLVRFNHPAYLAAGSTRSVVVQLANSDGDVQLDCAWLCHSDGALSIIPAGDELSASVLPATVDEPRELILAGDMFAGNALSWGRHIADPPLVSGVVAVTGAASPVVSARCWARWITHAME